MPTGNQDDDEQSLQLALAARATGAAMLLGLAGAVALRVGIAGVEGARHAGAGLAFGAACLVLALTWGWRPGPLHPRAVGAGLLGAGVLCIVPLAGSITGDLTALDLAEFPRWAAVVAVVAVAQEVLLRGAMFSALAAGFGEAVAVLVTALAFALMHVPMYGWAVLPLDLVVGVWLGGLRMATGGVAAPATAHVVADWAGWWLR